ncbi:unnamed protein product [Periconia digitata]|uniref:ABM domain-containing protein n=1 Tax=Periconia digitata TaxID=1303443 RepID=A0A9W4U3I8_9PLEO|nr:unnamed protein product [Periconia digitata]
MSDDSQVFWVLTTVDINPNKIPEALECFNEVIQSTKENEPDCLIYRYYRSEVGEGNTFYWIGKYKNRAAYLHHRELPHLLAWVKKWPNREERHSDIFTSRWVFHNMSPELGAIGWER